MSKPEMVRATINDKVIWEQGLRLFAMTNLSEANPFRKLIEDQAARSIQELMQQSPDHESGAGHEIKSVSPR
jgi:hypothetical protein